MRRVLTEPDQASLLLASFAALHGVLLEAVVLGRAVIWWCIRLRGAEFTSWFLACGVRDGIYSGGWVWLRVVVLARAYRSKNGSQMPRCRIRKRQMKSAWHSMPALVARVTGEFDKAAHRTLNRASNASFC